MESTSFIPNLLEWAATDMVGFMLVTLYLFGFLTFVVLTLRPRWLKTLLHKKRPVTSFVSALWLLMSVICMVIMVIAMVSDVLTASPL